MKKIVLSLLFILSFALASFAQELRISKDNNYVLLKNSSGTIIKQIPAADAIYAGKIGTEHVTCQLSTLRLGRGTKTITWDGEATVLSNAGSTTRTNVSCTSQVPQIHGSYPSPTIVPNVVLSGSGNFSYQASNVSAAIYAKVLSFEIEL